MKYQVNIYQSFGDLGSNTIAYAYDKWEHVLERIRQKKKHEKVLSIKEYHLVYSHPISLPPPDRFDEFLKRGVYDTFIKTPKEEIVTAKQAFYKNDFIEDEDFSNYCLEYDYLEKHDFFDLIYRGHAVFDLKNSDRKAIMYQLYQHSKSNWIFNLCFYQYRYLSVSDF